MLKQIQTTLTNFLNSIIAILPKAVASIDSTISLASTNPTKLISIVFWSSLVVDLIFGRFLGMADYIVKTIVTNHSIFTWPFAATIFAIALLFKKN